MKGMFKKLTSAMLLACMTFGNFVPVNAKETASPEATSMPADETAQSDDTGQESTEVPEVEVPEQDAPKAYINGEEVNSAAPEPAQSPVSTTEPAEKTEEDQEKEDPARVEADPNDPSFYEAAQEKIDAEKAAKPHATIYIGGSGYIDVTDKDGNIIRYRTDSMEYMNGKKKGQKEDTLAFAVLTGEENDAFHIKAVADDKEHVSQFEIIDRKTPRMGDTTDVLADTKKKKETEDDQAEVETDITLKPNAFIEIPVTFTQLYHEQPAPKENKSFVEKIKNLLVTPANAASGTVAVYGRKSNGYGGYYDATYYNDTFFLSSSTNGDFNYLLSLYRQTHGGADPAMHCQNHGDYAPANASYGFNYNVWMDGDVTVVDVTVNTRVNASWYWPWDNYFYNRPLQQGASGQFRIPPINKKISVNVNKKAKTPALAAMYKNDYSLEGAVFGVYVDGVWQTNITTDANGYAAWSGTVSIDKSNVSVQEVSPSRGYQKISDTLQQSVAGTGDKTANFNVYEPETPVDFTIVKNAEDGTYIAGSQLSLYNHTTGETFTHTSDGNPWYIKANPGKYTLTETDAPNGYYIASPIDFEVKPGQNGQTYTMVDKPIDISITKTDEELKTPVTGVRLSLKDENGITLTEWTTDDNTAKNGFHIPPELLHAGKTYRIEEVEPATGYFNKAAASLFQVSLTAPDKPVVLDVNNKQIDFYARKLDIETSAKVIGAVMQVTSRDGKTVYDEWTTGTEDYHKIDTSKLKAGETYQLHEKSAPAGYYLQGNDKQFTIPVYQPGKDNYISNLEVTMYDYPIHAAATKIDASGNFPVPGAVMALYYKGKEIDRWTTTTSPHTFSGLTAGETYQIKELQQPDGYYPSTAVKEFTVSLNAPSGDSSYVQTVQYDNKSIELYIIKRDKKTNELISGAQLQVTDQANGKVVWTGKSSNSSANGVQVDPKVLTAGHTYIVHEVTPPKGYYQADDVKITIPATWEDAKKNGTLVKVTMDDPEIEYSFKKTNASTGTMLAGVTLGVREVKADGSKGSPLGGTWTSEKDKEHSISHLEFEAGKTYELYETAAIKGFKKAAPVQFTIPMKPTSQKVEIVELKNYPIQFRLKKVDDKNNIITTQNGDAVEFTIYDANGTKDNTADDTEIQKVRTDDPQYIANGYFLLGDLMNDGTLYRIHESHTMAGYGTAQDEYVDTSTLPTDTIKEITVENTKLSIRVKKTAKKGGEALQTYTYTDGVHDPVDVGFKLTVRDDEDNSVVATIDTSDADYKAKGYAEISQYVQFGHTYTVSEDDYPQGYYKAIPVSFTVDKTALKDNTISIELVDPVIYARFRKEDTNGNVLTTVTDKAGNVYSFRYQVIDAATGKPVCVVDTKDADSSNGYVQFGKYLKEDHLYNLKEIAAPAPWKINTTAVSFRTPKYSTN